MEGRATRLRSRLSRIPALALLAVLAMPGDALGQAPPAEELIQLVAAKSHPYLLFTDLAETPAIRYQDRPPWSGWVSQARNPSPGGVSWAGFNTNGMDANDRRGEAAMMWAMGYLLTGDPTHLTNAVGQLLRARAMLSDGFRLRGRNTGRALIGYALAYDWLQPQFSAEVDAEIRGQLADLAHGLRERYPTSENANAHDRISLASGLAMIGLALADYQSGHGTESEDRTGPADWLRHGTVHLFEEDRFVYDSGITTPRGALQGTTNEGGYNQLGFYSIYWKPAFIVWMAAYDHALERRPLDDYPAARGVVTENQWARMPTRMDSQQGTRGQQYFDYYRATAALLSPQERTGLAWYLETPSIDQLRARRTYGTVGLILNALLYDDQLPQQPPEYTSLVWQAAEAAVLRSSWEWDADWVFFNAMRFNGPSDRHMQHHDNLAFELYSRGDYLLSDSGEIQNRGTVTTYGPTYAAGHNTMIINEGGPNKRASGWSFVNPAGFTTHVLDPRLDWVEAETTLNYTEDSPWTSSCVLDPPVTWRRAFLYPGKEYLLLVDDVASAGWYSYEFLFHLSSMNFEESQSASVPGWVKGDLFIGEQEVDWAKDVRTDVLTESFPRRTLGTYAGSAPILWRTTNLWNQGVELRLFQSVDAGQIILERTWGRRAQTKGTFRSVAGEVDHPVVRFRHTGGTANRITAILPRAQDTETAHQVSRVAVAGTGSALRLERDGVVDLVASGRGSLRYEGIQTDAQISLVRRQGDALRSVLLIRGQSLSQDGKVIVASEAPATHVAFHVHAQGPLVVGLVGYVKVDEPTRIRVSTHLQPKAVTYRPQPQDWVWPWAAAPEAVPIPFRREGHYLLMDVPAGAGQVLIEHPSMTPGEPDRLRP